MCVRWIRLLAAGLDEPPLPNEALRLDESSSSSGWAAKAVAYTALPNAPTQLR